MIAMEPQNLIILDIRLVDRCLQCSWKRNSLSFEIIIKKTVNDTFDPCLPIVLQSQINHQYIDIIFLVRSVLFPVVWL